MKNEPLFRPRHLDWEGRYNVRDLGGLLTADGSETRWRAVIRADFLGRLTPRGRRALLDYGVRTIIDLRATWEAQREPYVFSMPGDSLNGLTYLNLPIDRHYPHVSELIQEATTRAEVYCIILDHYPDAVVDVARAIVNAQPGGVVIHCHSGKDRTGIVSGLLLSLVGVPAETIAADYAESQKRLWPLYEEIVAKVGGEDQVGFWSRPTVTAETMHTMLAHVDTGYEGVSGYLEEAGLSSIELDRLRSRLRF